MVHNRKPLFGRGGRLGRGAQSHLMTKATSAPESAESADAISECRFYSSPFPNSRRNEGRFAAAKRVSQAIKVRPGMQVMFISAHIQAPLSKTVSRRKPPPAKPFAPAGPPRLFHSLSCTLLSGFFSA